MTNDLRKQAEARLALSPEHLVAGSPAETQRLLHELQVHQIELEMQNDELRKAQAEIEAGRARYFDLYDLAPVGYVTVGEKGLVLEANLTAATLLGVNRAALVKQPLTRFMLKEDQDLYYLLRKRLAETPSALRRGSGQAPSLQTCELRMLKPDGSFFWAQLDATATEGPDGAPAYRVVISDITERKRAEASLKRIEWMLSKTQTPGGADLGEDHDQGYGDLTELNRDGMILKSIGLERLKGLAEDYLDLLGTSSAIYEANGDYAYGIFSSGWCRMMDCASRNLCATSNNAAALNSGRWLCHESCWTDCCKRAVADGAPIDIECHGGIRMYAVPIMAHGSVVGVMNIGYGDPPKDPEKMHKLAETYHLDYDVLVREANAYDSRPPFIIELAKKRLHATARLIGAMIETKQSEDALRRSESMFRKVFEILPIGLWIADKNGTLMQGNPAGVKIWGMEPKVSQGEYGVFKARRLPSMEEIVPEEWALAHTVNKGETIVDELLEIDAFDGKKRIILNYTAPILDSNGVVEGAIVVNHDITDRKQAEVAHAKLQTQLLQAQKMESVGRLAGGVAHDFNNLLMGIMGYADLCRDRIEPGHPIREYLDEITHASERSAEITRQLLAFARKQTIAPRVLDLNDVVGGMLKFLQRLIGEDIKLAWRPGVDVRPVKLDPSQIDQILANLCVNARDAIAGVGEIAVETGNIVVDAEYCARHPEAVPAAYVFLAVSDDGCGMDKETLAQVFEPFFTTKGVGKGTGLGLATVYGIVKQNNGFIDATSEPGKGTTFKIYLPEVAAETVATTDTGKTDAPRGRGETILLVEDEESVNAICRHMLKSLDYKVLVAETPGEALKMAAQHPGDIHMLLTDVVMPGMDGRQLAKRICAVKPGVKVLFMSGYTADVIAQRGVLEEGVQFLSKPFMREDLARTLRQVMKSDVRLDSEI